MRRLLLAALAALLLAGSVVAGLVGALRWVDPPTSSVMVQHRFAKWRAGESPGVHHEWVPWAQIPKTVALAVIAAEDQRFPDHHGFDLRQLRRAWDDYRTGGRLRGASTLSQQVAKNLFLWHGRSPLRKGLEIPLTILIEGLWPKQRILEVYLNIAQFGPDTYGVGAASWRFFSRPVAALSSGQAARLAAVLPNPERYSIVDPSPHVQRRIAWIREQMDRLGGVTYLDRL
jgi:monofunctional biosynthetic peptidoglycan transglycosylase